MIGHVKSMRFQPFMELAATLLSFLLVMAVDSTRTGAASTDQQSILQQTYKLTKLLQKESADLMKTYTAFQGEMSEFSCESVVSVKNVPDPNISGLQLSEKIASIYTHLQAFIPHFKRVYEQQTDLQSAGSPLLTEIDRVSARSRDLAALVNTFYQSLFPNLPVPEPAGGPTTLPPRQNIFQQKVYGCVVLKNFEKFLMKVNKVLKIRKSKVRGGRKTNINILLLRMTKGLP